jgi:hypothetical protein
MTVCPPYHQVRGGTAWWFPTQARQKAKLLLSNKSEAAVVVLRGLLCWLAVYLGQPAQVYVPFGETDPGRFFYK